MRKLMLALVAGCMSAAVAGAYAATGSPADTDKAGRAGPGTSAGEMGAAKPTPTPGAASKGGSTSGASAGASAGTGGSAASTTGAGSSAGASGGTGGDDMGKGKRSRRSARASKG